MRLREVNIMLKNFIRVLGGDPNKRTIEKYSHIVDDINALEPTYEQLSKDELCAKTDEFRQRIAEHLAGIEDEKHHQQAEQDILDEILPDAFAVVREVSKRTIGLRHYDIQMVGGITIHRGEIAEMRTGEGKTLVATLPVYLNALTGRGVHLITVNDYLARRDARWMGQIYNYLGLTIGVLQMAARTENGQKAYLVDFTRESPHEDQHQLRLVSRREAYQADITYGTNSEFGFDYLRDNMTYSLEARVQRGHYYAIIDEVDNVLIDEARTPLIISGPASENVEEYYRMAQIVRQLKPEDVEVSEKDQTVTLTELGEGHVEELLNTPLRDPDRPEDITPEQARLLGHVEQALRAQYLFRRNKEYLVQSGKVVIVDEFTGRLMPGRRWSDGLHQAVEAKEGVKVEPENVTYATITIQNYFRMYQKLSGMSGTAVTESEEFHKIYELEVLAIPTNLEYQASRSEATLVELDGRDPDGYKYKYYALKDDPEKKEAFFRRKDYPDIIFRTQEAKFRAIATEILHNYLIGRPVLVGTTSVELSEIISNRLRSDPIRRLMQVLLLRDAWFRINNRQPDGRMVDELKPFDQPLEKLNISEMRKMARDLGISFSLDDEENVHQMLEILNVPANGATRLSEVLQGGVLHEVLNARKHTEESQIIAGAGALGAITIATNMAGRGVDIKLGGEIPEEQIATINRVLTRAGYENAYEMTMEERRQTLKALPAEDFGLYEEDVKQFLQHLDDMETVKEIGGLHVVGSERHEARRIDNQLRGRSARQGDPGSSRFFISLEDELMVRFGGEQANNLMQRFSIDDSIPLEFGLVSRVVESSQTRVEGANFDIRKHLLEYDDVLNTQRAAIYAQRDRVFVKDDLSDDIADMLQTEVNRRVPEALQDTEGPWKLLAWLEQVQPPRQIGQRVLPSYTIKLLLDQIDQDLDGDAPAEEIVPNILELAAEAIDAESARIQTSILQTIELTQERIQEQVDERVEALDAFIEGLEMAQEGEGEIDYPRGTKGLSDGLTSLLRIPVRLNAQQARELEEDPYQAKQALTEMIETTINEQNVRRVLWSVIRRLGEPLDVNPSDLAQMDWDEINYQIDAVVKQALARRKERLTSEKGPIARDLRAAIDKLSVSTVGDLTESQRIGLLMTSTTGTQVAFDKHTHRRTTAYTQRLNYTFFAARLFENIEPAEITADVLHHLEETLLILRTVWGQFEFDRLAAAGATPSALDERSQRGLRSTLGEDVYEQVQDQLLSRLDEMQQQQVVESLGKRAQTEASRQLFLAVITELWVDYLTQMEALRITISLESYAQRDPLVQYKSQAFELYQNLLSNTRTGVIGRIFTSRLRAVASLPGQQISAETAVAETAVAELEGGDSADGQGQETPVLAAVPAQSALMAGGDGQGDDGEGNGDRAGSDTSASTGSGKSKKRRRRRRR